MAKSPLKPKPITVSVKFLVDCDPGGGKPVFKAGTVKDLVATSANRWIRRGMAEKYVPSKKAKKKPAPKPRTRKKAEPAPKKTEKPDEEKDKEYGKAKLPVFPLPSPTDEEKPETDPET